MRFAGSGTNIKDTRRKARFVRKCIVNILVAAICCLAFDGRVVRAATLTSAGNFHTIVLLREASATDVFAAEELRMHLESSLGGTFRICREGAEPTSDRTFQLGTAKARALLTSAGMGSFADDESAYRVTTDVIAIGGGGVRGLAYGVYLFLERAVGCKWLTTAGDVSIPRHDRLEMSDGIVSEKPAIEYRSFVTFGRCTCKDSADTLFLFRNRINQNVNNFQNTARRDLRPALKAKIIEKQPNCHSFFRHVPPERYFKDHPDWYCQWTEGKRIPKQLCPSNPGLRKQLTENFLKYLEETGDNCFVDLSQQDDRDNPICYCDQCVALAKKYKTNGAALFDYLQELAPVVKRRFPGVIIHFLAYHTNATQHPPIGMRPFPGNVAAIFAPLDDDFSKSLAHPNNARSLQDIRDWCKVARVWYWEYPIVYTDGNPPFAGVGRCAENLRLAWEAGLTGTYHEQDSGTCCGAGFADLQTWVLTREFRDPSLDWRELRQEFCEAYYGVAAKDVIDYEEYLERGRENMKARLGFLGMTDEFITGEDILAWQGRFDAMEGMVAGDSNLVTRLREVRIPLDGLTVKRWKELAKRAEKRGLTVDAVYERAAAAYRAGVARRFTRRIGDDVETDKDRERALAGNGFLRVLESRRLLAKTETKPVPDDIRTKAAGRDCVEIYPGLGDRFVDRVEDPLAASGYAFVEKRHPEAKHGFPVKIGIYDRPHRKYTLAGEIPRKDVVADGVYHFYPVGRGPVTSSQCGFFVGGSERLMVYCDGCYIPGSDDEWEFYASIKVADGRCYLDRVVAIGPFPRTLK